MPKPNFHPKDIGMIMVITKIVFALINYTYIVLCVTHINYKRHLHVLYLASRSR